MLAPGVCKAESAKRCLCCRSDLEPIAEFPMKKCSLCSFSNGGQLFAAVGFGNVITVWNAVTHQVLATLKVSSCMHCVPT